MPKKLTKKRNSSTTKFLQANAAKRDKLAAEQAAARQAVIAAQPATGRAVTADEAHAAVANAFNLGGDDSMVMAKGFVVGMVQLLDEYLDADRLRTLLRAQSDREFVDILIRKAKAEDWLGRGYYELITPATLSGALLDAKSVYKLPSSLPRRATTFADDGQPRHLSCDVRWTSKIRGGGALTNDGFVAWLWSYFNITTEPPLHGAEIRGYKWSVEGCVWEQADAWSDKGGGGQSSADSAIALHGEAAAFVARSGEVAVAKSDGAEAALAASERRSLRDSQQTRVDWHASAFAKKDEPQLLQSQSQNQT